MLRRGGARCLRRAYAVRVLRVPAQRADAPLSISEHRSTRRRAMLSTTDHACRRGARRCCPIIHRSNIDRSAASAQWRCLRAARRQPLVRYARATRRALGVSVVMKEVTRMRSSTRAASYVMMLRLSRARENCCVKSGVVALRARAPTGDSTVACRVRPTSRFSPDVDCRLSPFSDAAAVHVTMPRLLAPFTPGSSLRRHAAQRARYAMMRAARRD